MILPMMIGSTLGGSGMNDRSRVLNSLLTGEAIIASLLGLFILTRPVAMRSAPGL